MTFRKNNWDKSILLYIFIGLTIISLLISVVYIIFTSKTTTLNKCPKCNIEYGGDRISCPDCKLPLEQIKKN